MKQDDGTFRIERIGDATLYLGDCAEVMASWPEGFRVDACVTDPPYGVNFVGKAHKDCARSGVGYPSFDDTPEAIASDIVPAISTAINLARSSIVTPGTECAMLYPKPADIGSIYNSAGTGSGRWGFKCSTPILFYGKCPYLATGKGRRPNSWRQPSNDFADKNDHPCPKPLGMMFWLVERASLHGETVLDPFMGSGTTGVAALQMGRKFIGIEREPKYFEIACRRIAETAGVDAGPLFRGNRLTCPEGE